MKGWIRQAGRRRFVFSVMLNELITHQKRFVGTQRLVRDFVRLAKTDADPKPAEKAEPAATPAQNEGSSEVQEL